MKIPSGWIARLQSNRKGTEIILDTENLVLCKDCRYRNTEDCKWRNDESPDDDDFCSRGEAE